MAGALEGQVAVVTGGSPAWTEEWLNELEFPVNGGINGLAAGTAEVVATEDYLVDPRIPHEESDQSVAERLALRGMASAPLRGPQDDPPARSGRLLSWSRRRPWPGSSGRRRRRSARRPPRVGRRARCAPR